MNFKFSGLLYLLYFLLFQVNYSSVLGEILDKDSSQAIISSKSNGFKLNVILFVANILLEKEEISGNFKFLEKAGFILAAKIKIAESDVNNKTCQSRVKCSINSLVQWSRSYMNMTTVKLSLMQSEEHSNNSPGEQEHKKFYDYRVEFHHKRHLLFNPAIQGRITVTSSNTEENNENNLEKEQKISQKEVSHLIFHPEARKNTDFNHKFVQENERISGKQNYVLKPFLQKINKRDLTIFRSPSLENLPLFPFEGLINVRRTKRGIEIDDNTVEIFSDANSKDQQNDELSKENLEENFSENEKKPMSGIMSAFKNSFFNDIINSLTGNKFDDSEDEDEINQRVGKFIQEPSLLYLIDQTVKDAKQQSVLAGDSGFIMVVDGLDMNDLYDFQSDFAKSIINVRKKTKKSETLIVVMGSCPFTNETNKKQSKSEKDRNTDKTGNEKSSKEVAAKPKYQSFIDGFHSSYNFPFFQSSKVKQSNQVMENTDEGVSGTFHNSNENHDNKMRKKRSNYYDNDGDESDFPYKVRQKIRDEGKTLKIDVPVFASGPGQKHLSKAKTLENIPFLIRDVIKKNGRNCRSVEKDKFFDEKISDESVLTEKRVRFILNSGSSVYLHTIFVIFTVCVLVF